MLCFIWRHVTQKRYVVRHSGNDTTDRYDLRFKSYSSNSGVCYFIFFARTHARYDENITWYFFSFLIHAKCLNERGSYPTLQNQSIEYMAKFIPRNSSIPIRPHPIHLFPFPIHHFIVLSHKLKNLEESYLKIVFGGESCWHQNSELRTQNYLFSTLAWTYDIQH